jgi:Fur family transcriptional regulator, ferric uptake regulator
MASNTKKVDALLALQKVGISKTSQRIAVLNILLTATKPLSAITIRQSLNAKNGIDKVTVYRILTLFKKSGIVREIASASGANYFEIATLDNPLHPHFSCRSCGTVTCLEPISFTQEPESILSNGDYSIDHVEINISGLCSDCRNTSHPEQTKKHYKKEV